MDIHLCGCQTDAVGVVHGLEHVRHQAADARIDLANRFCNSMQPRVGITKNRENGHGCAQKNVVIFATFSILRTRRGQ